MDDEAPHLFDPGPETPKPEAGDGGGLYVPPKKLVANYNHDENERVRALYKAHIKGRAEVRAAENFRSLQGEEGIERGSFVRALVAMAEHDNIAYYEGRKATHAKGGDAATDSVRTQLRQFWAGRDMPDYMLVLVEAVICDRKGNAPPGGYYSLQRRMPGQ